MAGNIPNASVGIENVETDNYQKQQRVNQLKKLARFFNNN